MDCWLGQTTDNQRAVGAQHFGAHVVAVARVAAEIHVADRAIGEAKVDHRVVDFSERGELVAGEQRAFGGDLFDLAGHQPAGQVEIVDAHIDHQTAAVGGVGVVERWAGWIAADALVRHWSAYLARVDRLVCVAVARIEAAHEPDLQQDPGAFDGVDDGVGVGER